MRNTNVSYSSFDDHVCTIHVLARSSSLRISTKIHSSRSILFIRRSSATDSIKGGFFEEKEKKEKKTTSIERINDYRRYTLSQVYPKSIGIVRSCVLPRCHVEIITKTKTQPKKKEKKEKHSSSTDRKSRNAFETSSVFLTY